MAVDVLVTVLVFLHCVDELMRVLVLLLDVKDVDYYKLNTSFTSGSVQVLPATVSGLQVSTSEDFA